MTANRAPSTSKAPASPERAGRCPIAPAQPRRAAAGWPVLLLSGWLAACAGTTGAPPSAGQPAAPGTGQDTPSAAKPSAPAGSASAAVPALPAGAGGTSHAPVADLSVLRPPVRAHYRELQQAEGRVYLLDPARSDVRIYAFRAGLGARFGHDHVIAVPHFSGLAWSPAKGLRGARADFGFRLAELEVDPPALRAETGGAFATPLDAEAARGTLEHLIGAQGFDAASHPWIEASATVETGELPVAIADVALSLHGETHHQRCVLRVAADDRRIELSGTLAFRQGDFGIKPYAVMGGLLAVDQLVAVEFHLRGVPLASPVP